MLDSLAIATTPSRPLRAFGVIGAFFIAVLALAPERRAPVSHAPCRAMPTEHHPRATIRTRAPGLTHRYLMRELSARE